MKRLTISLAALALGVAMAAVVGGEDAKAPDKKPLRILFVGNSYTQVNSLQRLIPALLESQGQKVEIGQFLAGGRSLKGHWTENLGTAAAPADDKAPKDANAEKAAKAVADRKGQLDKLLDAKESWDFVILQGQSRDPLDGEKWEFHKYAGLFVEKIRKAQPDAKIIFYLTWARQNLPEEQATITKAYLEVARQHNTLVAPVGEAWKDAFAARKDLVLHASDKSHPNPMGTYLAGCVFYATITGKTPVGLPAKIEGLKSGAGLTFDLKPEDAKFLQETAWKTVERVKAEGGK
ncbi:MAG: DUF4886 domain-containing protein [Planctomycetota bacterium]|nr:DUF4886 domain-containing protein [Planctomycetota bacterium]